MSYGFASIFMCMAADHVLLAIHVSPNQRVGPYERYFFLKIYL
uniref:Uncharacterized protein n=1 Tax=Arundo donax TaxID=35708 RepID=A0A0A9FDA4_ARUDO